MYSRQFVAEVLAAKAVETFHLKKLSPHCPWVAEVLAAKAVETIRAIIIPTQTITAIKDLVEYNFPKEAKRRPE